MYINKQSQGMPIGSLMFNMVAEWKMQTLENIIINDLKELFRIWIRYVDDIFVITNKFIDFPPLLEKLNLYGQNK